MTGIGVIEDSEFQHPVGGKGGVQGTIEVMASDGDVLSSTAATGSDNQDLPIGQFEDIVDKFIVAREIDIKISFNTTVGIDPHEAKGIGVVHASPNQQDIAIVANSQATPILPT